VHLSARWVQDPKAVSSTKTLLSFELKNWTPLEVWHASSMAPCTSRHLPAWHRAPPGTFQHGTVHLQVWPFKTGAGEKRAMARQLPALTSIITKNNAS